MELKSTANMEIKKVNRSNIYRFILRNGKVSKQQILQQLQLSLPTVTQNIEELQKEGLVAECGSIGNTGGRRAKCFCANLKAKAAIGLDITKNHIACVVVDLSGEVVADMRVRKPFEQNAAYYRYLGELVQQTIDEAALPANTILGVGIGIPALVDAENKQVVYGEILDFTGTTVDAFAQYIPYPALLYNDANAAGFAEMWARPDFENMFYIMLSNNIGGSILINKQVYSGEHLRSGEVGHMTIVPSGKQCYCGQKGCVDAYCSATVLSGITDGNLQDFFDRLQKGDKAIQKHWDTYLNHLALAINNLQLLFDNKIILGGYVGSYIGDYLGNLKQRVIALNPFAKDASFLHECRYKNQAIAAGAALNYISEFLRSI
ncbi:MAG: ROK family protein [Oscillospiraceae bacterium]